MSQLFYDPVDGIGSVCADRCEAWDMTGQHYHNGYELYMLTEGKRRIHIGDKSFILEPGSLLVIAPYVRHYFTTETRYIARCIIHFTEEHIRTVFSSDEAEYMLCDLTTSVIQLNGMLAETVVGLIARTESTAGVPVSLKSKLSVCSLARLLICLRDLERIKVLDNEGELKDENIMRTINYIHEHSCDPDLSLSDAAEYSHMSIARFCPAFKKTTGLTFLKYLNFIRAMAAERKISMTDRELAGIAMESGFSSVAHMTRIFGSVYGVPPSVYRKERKKVRRS